MGQAKVRGSKDQRVAEAVERARIEKNAAEARKSLERKAFAEVAAAAQAEREKQNAERIARGDKPLPERTARRPRLQLSALLAVAAISMASRRCGLTFDMRGD
jgi:hypothetical protein